MDYAGLTKEESSWSYTVKTSGRERTLHLDGRIPLNSVRKKSVKDKAEKWIVAEGERIKIKHSILSSLEGIVFEVRQGYKSKDSKRQNADIANASTAIEQAYLPVTLLLSNQMDVDVATRYELEGWVILRGVLSDSPLTSTYAFCKEILGFDLAGFFERYSPQFKAEIESVLKVLLSP
jgi:hypothetical protein